LMFGKNSLLNRLCSFYRANSLPLSLRNFFGEYTLGASDLRSLLLTGTRDATSDSPWSIADNLACYNDRARKDRNLNIPSWQLVRAGYCCASLFSTFGMKMTGRKHSFWLMVG
jgi:hypothetical protein